MFVRAMANWPPFRDGWCGEIHDRYGADFVARGIMEVVSPADVQAYERAMAAIDRYIDSRIGGTPRSAAPVCRPVRAEKRVVTGAEWRRSLGQKGPDVASIIHATREMQITMAHASLDDGQRTIDLTAATDTPIRRREYDFWDDTERVYDEILDMSPGSVRLERLNKGAPLLDSHNYYGGTQAMIGAVVPGSAKVRAGKLVATAKFSRSENGERAFQDARTAFCAACRSDILSTSWRSMTRWTRPCTEL